MLTNLTRRIWHILFAWTCTICFTRNERGETCSKCGAAKPTDDSGPGLGGADS